jgi:hypothetical protein
MGKKVFRGHDVETHRETKIVNRIDDSMHDLPIPHMLSHHQQLNVGTVEMPFARRKLRGVDAVRNVHHFAWTEPVFELPNLTGCDDDRGVDPVHGVRLRSLKSVGNGSTIWREMKGRYQWATQKPTQPD